MAKHFFFNRVIEWLSWIWQFEYRWLLNLIAKFTFFAESLEDL